MNEQSDFERYIADQLGSAGVGMPPQSAIEDTIARAGGSRRLPEWLALIKEPPMRTNSHLAVGSPAVRVVAILAATILLALALAAAGAGAQRLLAANEPIVVAADGSGDYSTIAEAIAAAKDGDRITIMPGRYPENVDVVGKDLTITGQGDRDAIVIEAVPGTPVVPFTDESELPYPFAILLADTSTHISNLTIVGQQDGTAIPIIGAGATPVLEDIGVQVMPPVDTEHYVGESISWREGASGELLGSTVEGTVGLDDAIGVSIVGNELPATCIEAWGAVDIEIRENTIHGCVYELGIRLGTDTSGLVEGNEIWVEDVEPPAAYWYSAGRTGIEAYGPDEDRQGAAVVTIRDNDIRDSRFGIQVREGYPALEIIGNRIVDNDMGVARVVGPILVSQNTISGSAQIGLELREGSPTVEGNTITENSVGLSLSEASAPALAGNTICGNATNIKLPADGAIDSSANEVCEDQPPA